MQAEIEAGRVVQTRPGNVPREKRYLDEQKGRMLNNIWVDIPNLTGKSKERWISDTETARFAGTPHCRKHAPR